MTDAVELKEGQIWQDCDKRKRNREVKIMVVGTDVSGTANIVWVVSRENGGPWGTRHTRIQKSRLKPTHTGYRLVQDVE